MRLRRDYGVVSWNIFGQDRSLTSLKILHWSLRAFIRGLAVSSLKSPLGLDALAFLRSRSRNSMKYTFLCEICRCCIQIWTKMYNSYVFFFWKKVSRNTFPWIKSVRSTLSELRERFLRSLRSIKVKIHEFHVRFPIFFKNMKRELSGGPIHRLSSFWASRTVSSKLKTKKGKNSWKST